MDDMISRQAVINEMKDMYTAAEEWAQGAHDDDTKARAESCMATNVELKLRIEKLPSEQPEIIYCKDCVKHNKGHGYYLDGTVIGIKDCCPLVEIRGMAQGHEFDYQYCAYAERRQDG